MINSFHRNMCKRKKVLFIKCDTMQEKKINKIMRYETLKKLYKFSLKRKNKHEKKK